MRGTEKQIVFAEKLIERFNHQMDELIRKCPEQYKNDWIARKEKISMILQESYAGDVIHILNINEKNRERLLHCVLFSAFAECGCCVNENKGRNFWR